MKTNIVGLKDLRENTELYISKIEKGQSFIIVRRSKPIFKLAPIEDESNWEMVTDFTLIKKGGVFAKDVISHL